ncbi:hypothetical protein BN1723_017571 [Verticillium longisporum]|uniref:ERAP1-like C-terminal domain-containing protein n=1 Tax=Verticillium longisporum TaxID=100787 RepID=A0A0G4L6N8_VERLO|nr:hypothetical protein BN1723_017571 [Verticillium longisporum]
MGPWISKIGHPVLTVAEQPNQISIKQSRFLSTGDVKPQDDETTWWIPLELEGKKGVKGITSIALEKKEDTITDIDSEFYKLNSGASGFYRVNYPPERLLQLGKQLDRLSIEDKIAIIGSAGDLAFSGNGTTAALLSFIQGFSKEDNYLVWSQVLDSIASVKSVFGEDEVIKKGLEAFTLKLIDEAVSKVGWDYPEGESYLTGLLRKRLLLTAGVNGHAGVTEEALKRWKAYVESPESNPLPPALRTPVFRVAVKHDPVKAVEVLKKEWFTTKSIDGKEVCLSASDCDDLIHTKGSRLPLSAPNSMNFLASCLDAPDDNWVKDNHVLYNVLDPLCTVGRDEECELDWPAANQAVCPHTMGEPVPLKDKSVVNVQYGTGDSVVGATGEKVDNPSSESTLIPRPYVLLWGALLGVTHLFCYTPF